VNDFKVIRDILKPYDAKLLRRDSSSSPRIRLRQAEKSSIPEAPETDFVRLQSLIGAKLRWGEPSMRTGTVSAICVLFSLICSPHPAAAQSTPSNPSVPKAPLQMLPAPATLFELPRGAETRSVPLRTDSTNGPTNPPQSWNLLAQQNRSNVDQLWSFKKGILPQIEATRCGHIVIFQAPNMDSDMIQDVPQEFSGNMPTFEGLPPCCRDFRPAVVPRNFPGLMPIPPRAPLVAPGRTPPVPNLGMRLNNLRP